MNFGRESWRKLYVTESMQHRLMPVLCRGLRDYLLRYAAEDGTLLAKTDNPAADLARALGAQADELDLVIGYVEAWLSDGFLTHKRGRLAITRYVEAQTARSPGAVRQQRYRDRDRDVTDDVTRDVTDDSPSDARATSQKKRIEENRNEEKVPPVSPPPGDIPTPKVRKPKEPKPPAWRRFPRDWNVTDDCRELAQQLGLNIAAEHAKILDWEFKTPHTDPAATFRNWLRESAERRDGRGQRGAQPPGLEQHNEHKQAQGAAIARRFLASQTRTP